MLCKKSNLFPLQQKDKGINGYFTTKNHFVKVERIQDSKMTPEGDFNS